jgi:hypothetical protein
VRLNSGLRDLNSVKNAKFHDFIRLVRNIEVPARSEALFSCAHNMVSNKLSKPTKLNGVNWFNYEVLGGYDASTQINVICVDLEVARSKCRSDWSPYLVCRIMRGVDDHVSPLIRTRGKLACSCLGCIVKTRGRCVIS